MGKIDPEILLGRFPKVRPALPKAIAKIYEHQYKENRQGKSQAASLAQKVEAWMHRKVAASDSKTIKGQATLEIGAGTLNQLPYEPDGQIYDIVEPFTKLYLDSPLLTRVRSCFADIAQLDNTFHYDRIISVATFEHLCDLPFAIACCGIHLKEGGMLQVAIPTEGGPLWSLGWRLTTGLEFRLVYGLDYGYLIRHEHVNKAWEVEMLLRYFFIDVDCQWFGLTKQWSLYQYFKCGQANYARCDQYLNQVEQD